jgi:hypothetical protein
MRERYAVVVTAVVIAVATFAIVFETADFTRAIIAAPKFLALFIRLFIQITSVFLY